MELMTVIVIIGILSMMVFSSVSSIRSKAERARCVNNLQGLYAAGCSYLLDNESWPQIPTLDITTPDYAQAWMDAFKPYQIGTPNWTCETVQKSLGSPPFDPANPQIDYLPASFDARPSSPWLFPTQPWFIERADAHGSGNLLILTNGQIYTLNDLKPPK